MLNRDSSGAAAAFNLAPGDGKSRPRPGRRAALAALWALWLSACGGGGGGDDRAAATEDLLESPAAVPPPASAPPPAPAPPAPASVRHGDMSGASLGAGASLNGAVSFPSDNAWNIDVRAMPVDANSDALIAGIGLSTGLHPDFGSGTYDGAPIGIPYVVVGAAQQRVPIVFDAYGSESDAGPYPVPGDAPVEGGSQMSANGDRHVIVVDRDANRLYELFAARKNGDGSWTAAGGAVFHLDANVVRPTAQPGWTSADAAGLPIFPGLARYDEATLGPGAVRHALRFTVQRSRRAYVAPATHWASSATSVNLPPMGMRVRLKASYAIPAGFTRETRALLTAMQVHGMIVADNGSNWYVSGAPDARWNNDALVSELRQVKGSDFEVVAMTAVLSA